MGQIGYLKVSKADGTAIDGGSSQANKVGWINLYGIDHEVIFARNPVTGQPQGKRLHMPFKVTKIKDKASPLLFEACCQNTPLTCEITMHRPKKGETSQEHYFTIKLTGATITRYRQYTPDILLPENSVYSDMEEVELGYEEILMEHVPGSKSADDKWTDDNA
ncbi:MAG: type VI secretion system tube protein Hcp [Desulfobacteraceae bacterium]|nr:type VI secretion system tube protein Hcp [Desulfobacteraceae bacterium]